MENAQNFSYSFTSNLIYPEIYRKQGRKQASPNRFENEQNKYFKQNYFAQIIVVIKAYMVRNFVPLYNTLVHFPKILFGFLLMKL